MKFKLLAVIFMVSCLAMSTQAGAVQRIGHTTLTPIHVSPADKGMYFGAIDPTNGYAYFAGTYIFKLDITGNLPAQVGPSLNIGQFVNGALDSAAGYLYLPRGGSPATIARYSLGAGTNAITAAGSLSLISATSAYLVLDDSDPNPANHNLYVVCSSSTATMFKVAASTFSVVSSIPLTPGQTNFQFTALADAKNGYGYFVSSPTGVSSLVVKIKFTPGTNAPIYIGATNLDTVPQFIDGGSIDLVHGYAYYGTYDSNTNNPGKVYKVKLESGDVTPTVVGHTSLRLGEGLLSASVADPVNGFVYFANDNTYPGGVYQLSMNGTNLPIEMGYTQFLGGTNNNPPPNGITTNNAADDGTNLPFGEVFIRSAVFDYVRGNAYFGQDSKPNQVVKVKLAQVDPFSATVTQPAVNDTCQLTFSNIPGANFSVFSSTNITLPVSNWNVLGTVIEGPAGQYQFTDPQPATNAQQFYRVRAP